MREMRECSHTVTRSYLDVGLLATHQTQPLSNRPPALYLPSQLFAAHCMGFISSTACLRAYSQAWARLRIHPNKIHVMDAMRFPPPPRTLAPTHLRSARLPHRAPPEDRGRRRGTRK